MMRIGVLSDTHDDVQATRCALNIFDSMDVTLIIHCGDIGESVLPLFKGRHAHFVSGNTDDVACLRRIIIGPEQIFHEDFGELELEGLRVAFLHGHDLARLTHAVASGKWDLVCHGHSHAYVLEHQGRTLTLNPGALVRTSHPSVAVVDLPSLEVIPVSV
jgi:uncharacterized protein